jgi:hypothetical protein
MPAWQRVDQGLAAGVSAFDQADAEGVGSTPARGVHVCHLHPACGLSDLASWDSCTAHFDRPALKEPLVFICYWVARAYRYRRAGAAGGYLSADRFSASVAMRMSV